MSDRISMSSAHGVVSFPFSAAGQLYSARVGKGKKGIKRIALIFCMALFANLFYIVPGWLQVLLNLCLLVIGHDQNHPFYFAKPVRWYAFFSLVLTIICVFNSYKLSYITSSWNCLLTLYVFSLHIKSARDIKLFVTSFAITGLAFCACLIPMLDYVLYYSKRLQDRGNEVGYLANAVSIGYSLMFIALSQLWALRVWKQIWLKGLLVVSFVPTITLIMLTGTRKALLAVFLFVFVSSFYGSPPKSRIRYFFLGAVATASILYLCMTNELLYSIIGQRLEGLLGLVSSNYSVEASAEERANIAGDAFQLYMERPLFGVGIDEMLKALGLHAHNNYLTLLCISGVFACIAYYAYPVCLLWRSLKTQCEDIDTKVFTIPMFLTILLTDFTATTFNVLYFPLFLCLSAMLLHRTIRNQHSVCCFEKRRHILLHPTKMKRILIIDNGGIKLKNGCCCVHSANGHFAHSLVRQGHGVSYCQFVTSNGGLADFDLEKAGIRCLPLRTSGNKWLSYCLAYFRLIAVVLRHDFVYIFYPGSLRFVALLCMFLGRKYGLYIRGSQGVASRFSALAYKRAQVVLTVSDHFTQMVNRITKRDTAHTIRPMIPYTVDDISASRQYPDEPEKFRLLFLARINAQKGLSELLQAVRILRDVGMHSFELDVVGDGDWKSELLQMIEEMGVGDVVTYHGPIYDDKEKAQCFAKAHIYVLPTYHEGFPRTLYEAMIFGTPVVTTFVGGIPSLMQDRFNCLRVEPRSVHSLVSVLSYAMSHYGEMAQYARNGQHTVAEVLSRKSHEQLLQQRISQ